MRMRNTPLHFMNGWTSEWTDVSCVGSVHTRMYTTCEFYKIVRYIKNIFLFCFRIYYLRIATQILAWNKWQWEHIKLYNAIKLKNKMYVHMRVFKTFYEHFSFVFLTQYGLNLKYWTRVEIYIHVLFLSWDLWRKW